MTTQLIRDCDESQLLAKIFPTLAVNEYVQVGPGDDCAVVTAPHSQFVVSTDILIQDQHFRTDWSSAADIGWRAGMQNLADIAAMGAVPSTVVVALGLPGDLPVRWLEDFYAGLNAACATVGAAIVGGDLSASAIITVALTVHGDMQGHSPVLRSGARPGDVVAHAGNLGWGAAGLTALSAGLTAELTATPADASPLGRAISLFLRPEPVLALGPVAARAGATSLMDVSDGLLRDATRIARASVVAIDLVLPAAKPGLAEVASAVLARTLPERGENETTEAGVGRLVEEWRLSGGEDHGLLGTFPTEAVVPPGFTVIGTVAEHGKGRPRLALNGIDATGLRQGWDHFR